MKKIIAILASATFLPFLVLENDAQAQENFSNFCSKAGTSGVMHGYKEEGKCQVKTYVEGDYLVVEVSASWNEGEKEIIRLKNDTSCEYWSTTDDDCKAEVGSDSGEWGGYVTAGKDETGFGYSFGNAYQVSIFNSSDRNNLIANDACMSAIRQIVNQISGYGTSVNIMAYEGENNGQNGNPTNRDTHLSMLLGGTHLYDDSIIASLDAYSHDNMGQVTDNILNSFQLQQNWADNIVEKCGDVAVVTFAQDQSGYFHQYAIQPNGKTKVRDCLFPGEPAAKDSWNYTYCT